MLGTVGLLHKLVDKEMNGGGKEGRQGGTFTSELQIGSSQIIAVIIFPFSGHETLQLPNCLAAAGATVK